MRCNQITKLQYNAQQLLSLGAAGGGLLSKAYVPTLHNPQSDPMPFSVFRTLNSGVHQPNLFFYHPDHLGSTGMVTNNSSNITQGMLYAPFGEIISDYSPAFHDSPMPNYAFNAKELDEENGMYYYSARYYAPPTFISRDPLFEKYPSISPYAYCRNNPLIRIDPNGEDDYEVDLVNKTITAVKGTEGQPDRFVITNEKGEKTYSKSYELGTITKLNSNSNIESYGVKGDNNGKELFEFLANNTGVEWAHVQTGEGGEDGKNYLFTTFEKDNVITPHSLLEGKIRVHNHNHPNGNTSPSDADKNSLLKFQFHNSWLEGRFPNKGSSEDMPASYIYTKGGGYTPFDPKTKALFETLDQINPIKNNKRP